MANVNVNRASNPSRASRRPGSTSFLQLETIWSKTAGESSTGGTCAIDDKRCPGTDCFAVDFLDEGVADRVFSNCLRRGKPRTDLGVGLLNRFADDRSSRLEHVLLGLFSGTGESAGHDHQLAAPFVYSLDLFLVHSGSLSPTESCLRRCRPTTKPAMLSRWVSARSRTPRSRAAKGWVTEPLVPELPG